VTIVKETEMALVVAFAGKIGSGKTTISTAVSQALGCKRASFGDYVRHVVSSRGLEPTRSVLQRVGTEILEDDALEFCTSVLTFSGWSRGESLVIDGLRHSETIPLLNRLVSPARLRIVYLEIDERSRVKRLGIREEAQALALRATDAHSSEQQVATTLHGIADVIIDARKPVEECVCAVLEWMAKQ
jgi:dephospho-CoA kinase